MKTRKHIPANSIYLKDGKTLSAYGLLCGYIHNNRTEKNKVEYLGKGYKELYFDSVYHVRTSKHDGNIWESFETLKEAKKFYNSIRFDK